MTKRRGRDEQQSRVAFERVLGAALAWPDVKAGVKYDGSPVLKVAGRFVAGLALHPSAERHTLVVRIAIEDRQGLLEDAPQTYYLTPHYEPHPVVLARLSQLDDDALRELIAVSRRLAVQRGERRPRQHRDP